MQSLFKIKSFYLLNILHPFRNFSNHIPSTIRMKVWDENIGLKYGISKCWCCKSIEISQFNFECGHIISKKKKGGTNIDNLRPICSLCNKSIGTKNMLIFMDDYGIKKK